MIRNKVFSLLFLCLFTISSYAQFNRYEMGIEGGPTFIYLRNNDYLNQFQKKAGLALCGGIFFQYNLNTHFSLRTNLFAERKGSRLVFGTISTSEFFSNLSLDYLTLPLLFRFTGGKTFRYFINAGPYVGYLLNQKFESYNETQKAVVSNSRYFSSYDYGISGGIGIAVPVKEHFSFSLEIRENFGLYNIGNVHDGFFENYDAKTQSLNILVALTYKFGMK